MEKLEHLSDDLTYKIVTREIEQFKRLVQGHIELLKAIGNL